MQLRCVRHLSANSFLVVSLFMLFVVCTPSNAQTARLENVVHDGKVEPRVDLGDKEIEYTNGQPGQVVHTPVGTSTNRFVPVEKGEDGKWHLYLLVGDEFKWVEPDGHGSYVDYRQPQTIIFEPLDANPCRGINSSTCNTTVAGSPYYRCDGCGDPRLVIHGANANLATDLDLLKTAAEQLQTSAAATEQAAQTSLESLQQEKDLSPDDRNKISSLLEAIRDDATQAEKYASTITNDTQNSINVIDKHPTTKVCSPEQAYGGPEIDLLCTNAPDGKALVLVGQWHGDLNCRDIRWVNARNLESDWSVSAVTINSVPPDKSCAEMKKMYTPASKYSDYTNVCTAQKPPTSMTFDLQITRGECSAKKVWHCEKETSRGGACTQR